MWLRVRPLPARLRAHGRTRRRRRLVLPVAGGVLGTAALAVLTTPARVTTDDSIRHIDDSMTRATVSAAPGQAPAGKAFSGVPAVGALFPAGGVTSANGSSASGLDANGGHFCTASVVHSPSGDLAVTAAHCVSGTGGQIVFVPGYHDGLAPYGSWLVTRVFTDPEWESSQDPDDDVAFLQLATDPDGTSVEDITGAEQLATGQPEHQRVKVIGYPEGSEKPVWCVNWTQAFSPTQLEFDCGGYPNGTSGGPFIASATPSVAGEGTVIGVIGGYEQGGDTPEVSYSIVFGPNVASLYSEAETSGP
jgi:V8-like Glu-specific endopeptidase